MSQTIATKGIAASMLITGLVSSGLLSFAQPAHAGYCTYNCPTGSSGTGTVAPPKTPVIGVATSGVPGGAITATANWSAPPADSDPVFRAEVNGYRVLAKRWQPVYDTNTQTTRWVVVGTTTSEVLASSVYATPPKTLSMTLPGTGTYSFQVQAMSGAGDSPYSAASNLVTGQ